MGPALIEPDHPQIGAETLTIAGVPQWGRLSSSRITLRSPEGRASMTQPQWGRLSSSRITRVGFVAWTGVRAPQWGRLSSSRITHPEGLVGSSFLAPQWGRLSSSRITDRSRHVTGNKTMAAMGPALIEPDHGGTRRWVARTASSCRNGAGSHRAGSRREADR